MLNTRLALAAALLVLTSAAGGAELGSLKLLSNLGQPLKAEIDLRDVRKGERLSARIAPAASYRRSDLVYTATAGAAKVAVRRRAGGEPYLLITTAARTNEPIVELLVELTSAGRTATANYTLFLNPPLYQLR